MPPFEHLVVLMLENRSFDHMLGFIPRTPEFPIDGLDPANLPTCDPAIGLAPVPPTKDAKTASDLEPDPAHDFVDVNVQIFGNSDGTENGPLMRGFVKDYAATSNDVTKGTKVMKCFSPQSLPILSTLGQEYAVCDRWFSSVPGSTIPNRLFAHAASSNGSVTQDAVTAPFTLKTIFNVMDNPDNPYSYRIYTSTPGGSILLSNWYLIHHQHGFRPYSEFQSDCAHGDLASYTFIEPRYDDDLASGLYANSQHPDFPVDEGEKLIKEVYTALTKSPRWPKTLLLIVYDEHGGLYDHVAPPKLTIEPQFAKLKVPPSTAPPFAFDRLGVRVPAVFVSPLIKAGTIIPWPPNQPFDHCSIIATVRKLFCLSTGQTPFNWREAQAPTFDNILNLAPADIRTDIVELPEPFISAGNAAPPAPKAPTDLTMYMAQSMQYAAESLGVQLPTNVSGIQSSQDALDFLRIAAAHLARNGRG